MRRRDVIVAALLVAAGMPAAVVAQTDGKIWRIGWLHPASLSIRAVAAQREAFREAMRELGYVEGRNVTIEYRWAEGRVERLPELAAELIRTGVDVIVVANMIADHAVRQVTTSIPVVMVAGDDPVGQGVAASLARPGGNVTGLLSQNDDLYAKRIELLLEVAPRADRIAVLADPGDPLNRQNLAAMSAAARTLGVALVPVEVVGPAALPEALTTVRRAAATALVVQSGPLFLISIRHLVALVEDAGLPAIYGTRTSAEAGGLISYGFNSSANFRRSAAYVDRILKGAKPADLPIEQPTKFELVINLKTAKAMGITIPPTLLARADEVIE